MSHSFIVGLMQGKSDSYLEKMAFVLESEEIDRILLRKITFKVKIDEEN